MTARPPRLRVEPADEARLQEQAHRLARGEAVAAPAAALEVVTFTLAGRPLAVEAAAVERAVARLGATAEVPQAGGRARAVAWVDEQPVAVADLAALAGLPARPPEALAAAPALLVAAADGPAAVAVEGPLELAEEPLLQVADPALDGLPGLAIQGRLAGGALLLPAAWLRARAGGPGAP